MGPAVRGVVGASVLRGESMMMSLLRLSNDGGDDARGGEAYEGGVAGSAESESCEMMGTESSILFQRSAISPHRAPHTLLRQRNRRFLL
jgi:hypothetical protein